MFEKFTLEQFVTDAASAKPTPGGGSVAALTASAAPHRGWRSSAWVRVVIIPGKDSSSIRAARAGFMKFFPSPP